MKICMMSAASLNHTVRWANAMAERGHQVDLITMHEPLLDELDERVQIHRLKYSPPFGYYLNRQEVRSLLKKIQPDLLHAHYASGYGTLARLAKFKPFVISVWGSDVYLYPKRGRLNRRTLERNLLEADLITSTSAALKEETKQYITPEQTIEVIPFGIDANLFQPDPAAKEPDNITIGIVKRLRHEYGVDTLIKTVAKLTDSLRQNGQHELADRIRLLIVGDGPVKNELVQLTEELHIAHVTEFVPAVPNDQVPHYVNQLDIYCALSRSESFSVSALEAAACEIPAVVSNVGGLPEVVQDGQTGFVVNRENKEEIADRLLRLIEDETLRRQMGQAGREFVKESYNWAENVAEMERLYERIQAQK